MKYINALKVIPNELLGEIRNYNPEGFLYIPRNDPRKEWGRNSGQKYDLAIRNGLIYKDFQNGKSVNEISKKHYLSESSIYRILKNYQ